MSISAITSTTTTYTNPYAQAKQDMQSLQNALSSGNLSDAQNAYSQLQQTLPSGSTSSGSQNTGSATQAFQNIGSALQSGNLSAAQQAFSNLQSAMKGAGHGHHHHRGGGAKSDTSTTAANQVGSVEPGTYSASGFGSSTGDSSTTTGVAQSSSVSSPLSITV